jgi:hypothetical protein
MLLYAVAALPLERAACAGWFRRSGAAHGVVISRDGDVSEILLRVPDCWNIVDEARCHGLHDDAEIMQGDPRFARGFDTTACAVVGHSDGERFVLLLQINAAEALLLPESPYVEREAFGRDFWPA